MHHHDDPIATFFLAWHAHVRAGGAATLDEWRRIALECGISLSDAVPYVIIGEPRRGW